MQTEIEQSKKPLLNSEKKNVNEAVDGETFIVYKYRQVIAIIFAFSNVVATMQVSWLVPIAKILSDAYGVSTFIANFCITDYLIITTAIVLVSNWALDNRSLAFGIRIGCILTLIGALLKLLVVQGFYWIVISSVFTGLGSPFLLNGITKIGSD